MSGLVLSWQSYACHSNSLCACCWVTLLTCDCATHAVVLIIRLPMCSCQWRRLVCVHVSTVRLWARTYMQLQQLALQQYKT